MWRSSSQALASRPSNNVENDFAIFSLSAKKVNCWWELKRMAGKEHAVKVDDVELRF